MDLKATADKTDDSILDGIAVGSALGAGLGTVLPLLLGRFRGVPQQFLNRTIMSRAGALTGGVVGGFADSWLPRTFQQARAGYRAELSNLQQTKKAGLIDGFLSGFARDFPLKKRADEMLKGIGAGGMVGAAISAGAALPVFFGRLGKRLPQRLLNKMLLGRALSGATIGASVGGITSKSKPKDNIYHYYYHKSLKEKGLGE